MASDGSWGVDRLVAAKGKVSFPIPSCIEAGDYLLRVEIIGEITVELHISELCKAQMNYSPSRCLDVPWRAVLCEVISFSLVSQTDIIHVDGVCADVDRWRGHCTTGNRRVPWSLPQSVIKSILALCATNPRSQAPIRALPSTSTTQFLRTTRYQAPMSSAVVALPVRLPLHRRPSLPARQPERPLHPQLLALSPLSRQRPLVLDLALLPRTTLNAEGLGEYMLESPLPSLTRNTRFTGPTVCASPFTCTKSSEYVRLITY